MFCYSSPDLELWRRVDLEHLQGNGFCDVSLDFDDSAAELPSMPLMTFMTLIILMMTRTDMPGTSER